MARRNLAGSETDLGSLLRSLVDLEHEAVEAYHAGADRVKLEADRAQVASFLEEHRKHLAELSGFLHETGADERPSHVAVRRVLTRGRVMIYSMTGGDKSVLEAMKGNEDDTNRVYERALLHAALPADLRNMLDRTLADERRHRAWFEARISAMTPSTRW